jgi:hypothetical protein
MAIAITLPRSTHLRQLRCEGNMESVGDAARPVHNRTHTRWVKVVRCQLGRAICALAVHPREALATNYVFLRRLFADVDKRRSLV